MKKEREIPRYLGSYDDLYQYNSGGTFYFDSDEEDWRWEFFDSRLISQYHKHAALRNSLARYNKYTMGTERIISSERKKPLFNSCFHEKHQLVYLPFGYGLKTSDTVGNYAGYLRSLVSYAGTPMDIAAPSFLPFVAAQRRAYWEMQPRFEGEVSMLNFLFELKDFKDVAKHLARFEVRKIGDRMRSFRNKLRRIDKKLYANDKPASIAHRAQKDVSSGTKVAANVYLINEFALKPLISDVTSLVHQAGLLVSSVQQEFKTRGGLSQMRHYSETEVLESEIVPYAGSNFWRGLGYHIEDVFTATSQYKYNYIMRKQSDAFMRYFGLQFNLETLWNAIPFSFLLDYFYKVGNAIHAMSVDPNVKVLEQQYCESICRTYSNGVVTTGDERANLAIDGKIVGRGVAQSGHTGSIYIRRVTTPNRGTATPKITLPSGRQGVTMGALARCFFK